MVPVDTTELPKKRPWKIHVNDLAASGEHRFWVFNLQGTGSGSVLGNLYMETRGGTFSLDVTDLDLDLGPAYLNGDAEIYEGGTVRGVLAAGINLLIPFLDRVEHKVVVLERQLDAFNISVITRDNVEVILETTVFFRVLDAAASVYRIRDVPLALRTTAESIIRSAAGKLELDEIQSSRQQMNEEILKNLRDAAEVWGLEITRSEITDVRVDEATKQAQRQQLNAERERRATVAKAEGDRERVQL